jgi:hypothetical protein
MTGLIFLVGVLISLGTCSAMPYKDPDCIKCHNLGGSSPLTFDVATYQTSVHAAGFSCRDCHRGVKSEDHTKKPGSGRVDCLDCHQKKNRHGGSIAGNSKPQCADCHSRHRIFQKAHPASTVHAGRIVQTCRNCHPEESGDLTYLSLLPSLRIESHNKQDLGTHYSLDNCLGCHQGQGAHGEVMSLTDDTCASCHINEEGKSTLLGYMHTRANLEKKPGVYAVAFIYQFSIIFLIWGGVRRLFRKK